MENDKQQEKERQITGKTLTTKVRAFELLRRSIAEIGKLILK